MIKDLVRVSWEATGESLAESGSPPARPIALVMRACSFAVAFPFVLLIWAWYEVFGRHGHRD